MGVEFVSQPFVCGVLGTVAEQDWRQLLDASPHGTYSLDDQRHARFAATARSRGLERTRAGWCWGRYIARNERPVSIGSASDELGLAGYWRDEESGSIVVHGDALGFQELYFRVLGDALLFSNRIAPLAAVRPSDALRADWPAWARYFTFLGFTGSDTGLHDIRRLERSHRLTFTAGVARVDSVLPPAWLASPSPSGAIDGLADVLVGVIPRHGRGGIDLTLSGGHDSRLLLAAAQRRKSGGVRAFLTPHENGWDDDTRLAREVARAAHIHAREVKWTTHDWIVARKETAQRLEYQTALHNWLSPLAQSMHRSQRPLLDGLAGDKLLHYHAKAPDSGSAAYRAGVLRNMGGWRTAKPGILSDVVRDVFTDITSEYWDKRTAPWGAHPYAEVLYWIDHRTNRAIAASPFRLFGPERNVVTPLIDPHFVAAVLGSRHSATTQADIRQRLLDVLNPTLAALATTNTLGSRPRSFLPRGLSVPEARLDLARSLRGLPFVDTLFAPQTLASLTADRRLDSDALTLLRVAGVLADWYREYGGRLANPYPEWA